LAGACAPRRCHADVAVRGSLRRGGREEPGDPGFGRRRGGIH